MCEALCLVSCGDLVDVTLPDTRLKVVTAAVDRCGPNVRGEVT